MIPGAEEPPCSAPGEALSFFLGVLSRGAPVSGEAIILEEDDDEEDEDEEEDAGG